MSPSSSAARADVVTAARPASAAAAAARTIGWGGYAAAASTGPLLAAAFLEPGLYPLTWIAFVPLLWVLLDTSSDRDAALVAFVAGFITNFLGFYWLIHTIHVFGGFPVLLAIFFYACLTAFCSLQFVLFGVGLRRVRLSYLGLAPALLWVALEFLFPKLFPWRVSNSQFHLPVLLQSGDLAGPYLLTLAIVWFNAALVLALKRPRRPVAVGAAMVLVAALVAYGHVRWPQIEAALDAAKPIRVALVQGNVSIRHKRHAAFFDVNVERYRALSKEVQNDADVIIWPETVAQWWVEADARTLAGEDHPFPDVETHLVYGGLAYRYTDDPDDPETFNSAFHVGPGGNVLGRYDKHILMPFGEYLPGGSLLPWIKQFSPQTGDYTPGRSIDTFSIPGAKLGPLICYEDVVTDIPRYMTLAGAQILFNILNDAWFGDSAGPYEHQQLALWRAVENRRYLLRSSNSGVTSIIDPLGRVTGEIGTFREGVLQDEVRPLSLLTVYTRMGDVFAWLATVAAAVLLIRAARRRVEPAADGAE